MAVGWVGRVQPIPRNVPYIAAACALAGQYIGSKVVIFDSGSGAPEPMPPEMVKYAGLENLLLISRDINGFSRISKPAEKEIVKTFLENEIGIDEIYVQDLFNG